MDIHAGINLHTPRLFSGTWVHKHTLCSHEGSEGLCTHEAQGYAQRSVRTGERTHINSHTDRHTATNARTQEQYLHKAAEDLVTEALRRSGDVPLRESTGEP